MTQDLQHNFFKGLEGRGVQGGILFLRLSLAQILLFKSTLFFFYQSFCLQLFCLFHFLLISLLTIF